MMETLEDIYDALQVFNPRLHKSYDEFEDWVWNKLCIDLEDKEPGAWVESGCIRVTRTPHSYRISLYPYAAIPIDQFEDYE